MRPEVYQVLKQVFGVLVVAWLVRLLISPGC